MVITPFQQICREKLSAVSIFSIPTVFIRAKENWHDRHLAPIRSGVLESHEKRERKPLSWSGPADLPHCDCEEIAESR